MFVFNILFLTHLWEVNIGLGNGLVLSGNQPLPEPVLTNIYVAIYGITRPQLINP